MLKIKPADMSTLRAAIAPIDTPERRAAYLAGAFPRADRVRDLDMRYRWDALHASRFPVPSLYAYMDDSSIDSALRAIVAPLRAA